MPRIAVVTYLVAMTLAGPSLCCCSLASWMARPGPEAVHTSSAVPTPRRCCCCCQETDPGPQDSAHVQPVKIPHRPGDCPCRKNRRVSPAWCDAGAAQLRLAGALAPLDAACTMPRLTLRTVLLSTHLRTAIPAPFGADGDILRAPGVQRC